MSTTPRYFRGPFPNPSFDRQVAAVEMQPNMDCISGEVTASVGGRSLGVARYAGKILGVHIAVGASGKDDSNDLYFEADVMINGVTCLTTKPQIAHVSGEASSQKSTLNTDDTGLTQAVVNVSASEFAAGDVLTWNMLLTRTASPTTEIANPSVIVEVEPL